MTPQILIQTDEILLQNVKQIHKHSAQQETLIFENFETVLTLHLEKSFTPRQEILESYFGKISKTLANIECCQNRNTKTLQQNIANSKNELIPKEEIIKTVMNN